jgi:hypothetical protein
MEKGLYLAHVSDDGVQTAHIDEDKVYDAQTTQMFRDRNKATAKKQRVEVRSKRDAERCAARKAHHLWTMLKECTWLATTAALVFCTYRWGLYVAISAIVGCSVALCCRIIHHITVKE